MSRQSEWAKKRYAEDPVYREKRLASHRAFYAAHRDEINARRRHKWNTDPKCEEKKAALREQSRKTKLKIQYGLSLEDYDRLLALQHGVCAICKKTSDEIL